MTHPLIHKVFSLCLAAITSFSHGNHLGWFKHHKSPTVHANGSITFDCGVPTPDPIFTILNMAPGKTVERECLITNDDTVTRQMAIKGFRTGPGGQVAPLIESVLDFSIHGSGDLYGGTTGAKTLLNFFNNSSTPDGILLFPLSPGASRAITLVATFPTSAGNEYQNKAVIFDIDIGTITGDHLVVNEVYYQVDNSHGVDGSNSSKKKGQNDEWVEIYNPTGSDVSLKNWTISDNEASVKINANKSVKAKGFALLSKDGSVWKEWNEGVKAEKVEIGQFLKLDNNDHLTLKNQNGLSVDIVGWGSNTVVWPVAVPGAALGKSIERGAPGLDSNLPADWLHRSPPTPGN